MRHKLLRRRKEEMKKRKKESSNDDGEDENRMHLKCGGGDEVLSAATTEVVDDKRSQITDADRPIRSNVMIAKDEASMTPSSVSLKNVICKDAELVGKKKSKKTLGALTLEKIRQKHGMVSDLTKRPLKERLELKPRVEVRKKKKRIELIKRGKKEEEEVLIKKETCGTLSRYVDPHVVLIVVWLQIWFIITINSC